MNIDVDRNIYSPFGIDGDSKKAKSFMQSSGILGSGMEHAIFEQFYNASSVSAVKIIQVANGRGIPVYTINSTNVDEILPKLQVSDVVKSGIQSAVASGQIVTIPERNIDYYNWTGIGYIVLDPESGAGAYMISGGIAGGALAQLKQATIDLLEGFSDLLGYIGKIPGLPPRLKSYIKGLKSTIDSIILLLEEKISVVEFLVILVALALMLAILLYFAYVLGPTLATAGVAGHVITVIIAALSYIFFKLVMENWIGGYKKR